VLGSGLHDADEELERRVAVRMQRQKAAAGLAPPELWVVMDETVLRRPMVPSDVMRAQIDRLIEALDQPEVKLQIMPFGVCAHEGMYGPFHIFRFPHRRSRTSSTSRTWWGRCTSTSTTTSRTSGRRWTGCVRRPCPYKRRRGISQRAFARSF